MSRVRTWLLPFALGGGSQHSSITPISWNLSEVMELWWRLKELDAEFSINATYDGETRDISRTLTTTRRKADHTTVLTNELDLISPGLDASWNSQDGPNIFYLDYGDEAIDDWGGSDAAHPVLDSIDWLARLAFFPTVADTGSIARRATWNSDTDISPSLDLRLNLGFFSGATNASTLLTTTNIQAGPTPRYEGDGTLFGDDYISYYWALSDEGDATGYTGPVINNLSVVITKKKWFEYRSSGANPVWNETSGAQILNPVTASVP